MKYTLNEDKAKLVLEERLILVEAGDTFAEKDAAIKKLAAYNDDLKAAVIEKINGKNSSAAEFFDAKEVEDLRDKENKAREALKGNEFNNISGPVTAYTRAIRDLTGKVKDNGNGNPLNGAPNLKEKLDQVDELARQLQTEQDNAKKTEIYSNLQAAFDELSAVLSEALNNAENQAQKPDEKAEAKIDTVEGIWRTVANTLNTVNSLTEDDKSKAQLKALAEGVKEIDINAEVDAIMANLEATRKACSDFAQAQEAREFEKKADAVKSISGKKDWAKLFTDAGNDTDLIDEIWDDYYETEWGADEEKVKDLGIAFVKELSSLGYTEATNPFITYIKYAFKHGFNLTARTYPALHNAYVNGYITNQDLRKTSESAKSDDNLIYCKDLFNDAPMDIYEKLNIQRQIPKAYPTRVQALRNIYEDDNMLDLVVAIFSNQIPIKELASANPPQNNLAAATLRPLTDVKTAFSLCFGKDSEEEEAKKDTNKDIKEIASKLKQNRLDKKAPSYIAIKYDKGNGRLLKLAAKENGGSIASLSENEIRTLAGLLNSYDFNEATLEALIKAFKEEE